jgi:hypothetical protein
MEFLPLVCTVSQNTDYIKTIEPSRLHIITHNGIINLDPTLSDIKADIPIVTENYTEDLDMYEPIINILRELTGYKDLFVLC